MSIQPISEVILHIKKSAFNNGGALTALDRGCTLTKVAYVAKEDFEKSGDFYAMRCVLFENRHFEEAVEWTKSYAALPEGKKIHLTGVGGASYKKLIESKLERETLFIDENSAVCLGLVFLVNNVPLEELCFPTLNVDFEELKSFKLPPVLQKLKDKHISTEPPTDSSNKWPAIYVISGSGAGILQVDGNQKANAIAPVALGGKSFMGLANCLLGTTNYDEIMDLASKGDRRNVDTQVFEILNDNENSPFGKLPPDLPTFSFGKSTDHDKNIDCYRREDLAASLLGMVAATYASAVNMVVQETKIHRVYFGGNMFRGERMRMEIDRMKKLFSIWSAADETEFYYLKTGHTGALGALSCVLGEEKTAF